MIFTTSGPEVSKVIVGGAMAVWRVLDVFAPCQLDYQSFCAITLDRPGLKCVFQWSSAAGLQLNAFQSGTWVFSISS